VNGDDHPRPIFVLSAAPILDPLGAWPNASVFIDKTLGPTGRFRSMILTTHRTPLRTKLSFKVAPSHEQPANASMKADPCTFWPWPEMRFQSPGLRNHLADPEHISMLHRPSPIRLKTFAPANLPGRRNYGTRKNDAPASRPQFQRKTPPFIALPQARAGLIRDGWPALGQTDTGPVVKLRATTPPEKITSPLNRPTFLGRPHVCPEPSC